MHRSAITCLFFLILLSNAYSSDFPAVLKRQQTRITFTNGQLIQNHLFEIQINNRAGEKYTEVKIPYSKMIRLGKIQGQITDCSGKVLKKLNKSDITQRSFISEISLYEDSFIKEFTLKHNTYPYCIVYSYEYTLKEFVNIENWAPVLNDNIPTIQAELLIQVPENYPIDYRYHNIDNFKIDSLEKLTVYSWKTSYSGLIEKEAFSPPTSLYQPFVSVMPLKFIYYKEGSAESWQSFGKWQNELNKGLSDLTESDIRSIRQMVEGVTNPKDKVRILYNHMQDFTRYINISIRHGGLKPYPASYVASKRYGDCKALSVYFKAVLEAVDIPSFYCKIDAGENNEPLMVDFPSPQFNHIILCVPINTDTLWVDCTSKEALGFAGTFIQNRDVLVVNQEKSFLSRTPQLTEQQVLNTRLFQIKQDGLSEHSRIEFNYLLRGNEYSEWLNNNKSLPSNSFETYLRKKFNSNRLQIDSYGLKQASRDSSSIKINGIATSSELFKYYGNDIIIHMIPFEIPHLRKESKRSLPIRIDYAMNKIDTLNYDLPVYSKVGFEPESMLIETPFGSYQVNYTLIDNKLQVVKRLMINSGNYPVEKYPEFFDFITKINAIESSAILVLQKS